MLEAAILFALWFFFRAELPWLWVIAFVLVLPGLYSLIKGAPYVPTPQKIAKTMFDLAELKPGERFYDLGCGDGRLVLQAAKRGAIATGYEFSIPTYLLAKIVTLFRKNANVQFKNFWLHEYPDADVIFCYLLVDSMHQFERAIWPTLPAGCRVVSHAFRMKEVKPAAERDGVVLYMR